MRCWSITELLAGDSLNSVKQHSPERPPFVWWRCKALWNMSLLNLPRMFSQAEVTATTKAKVNHIILILQPLGDPSCIFWQSCLTVCMRDSTGYSSLGNAPTVSHLSVQRAIVTYSWNPGLPGLPFHCSMNITWNRNCRLSDEVAAYYCSALLWWITCSM